MMRIASEGINSEVKKRYAPAVHKNGIKKKIRKKNVNLH